MSNSEPTGWLVILGDKGGMADVGTQLTARPNDVRDEDGIDKSTVRFAWLRDGVPILGATSNKYRITDADVGTKIKLLYRYADGKGTREAVLSKETIEVPSPDGYWEKLYLKHIGKIDPKGLAWWRAAGEKLFLQGIEDSKNAKSTKT